jgi:hypothetical protein
MAKESITSRVVQPQPYSQPDPTAQSWKPAPDKKIWSKKAIDGRCSGAEEEEAGDRARHPILGPLIWDDAATPDARARRFTQLRGRIGGRFLKLTLRIHKSTSAKLRHVAPSH